MQNKTWELIEPIPGKRTVCSKWTFRTKRNADGSIERYKVKLGAEGYSQKYGCDYDDTYMSILMISQSILKRSHLQKSKNYTPERKDDFPPRRVR